MQIFGKKSQLGHIEVVEEAHQDRVDHKNLVARTTWSNNGMPDLSFAEQDYFCKKDGRLVLARDTFKQMILGNGIRIKAKNEDTKLKVMEWMDDIYFEEKVEDGLDSYLDMGNLLFEKYPKMADIIEIDITLITAVNRDEKGRIGKYIQDNGTQLVELLPQDVAHLKLTNARREIWGRGMFDSLLTDRSLPNGTKIDSPIISMWKVERAMPMIFDSYASPIMMIHFKDAGKEFIDSKKEEFKKVKPGAKILTDKEFEVKIFEVSSAAKFTDYVKHFQENIMEVGTQFPLQMFNAGFTARASSETTDSVVLRKIRRMQKRLSTQLKHEIFDNYLLAIGKDPRKEDVIPYFDTEFKSELTVDDVNTLFRTNILKRSEVRKSIGTSTNMELDMSDMEDLPPITSVTPTNGVKPGVSKPVEESFSEIYERLEDLSKLVKEKVPNPRGRPRTKIA